MYTLAIKLSTHQLLPLANFLQGCQLMRCANTRVRALARTGVLVLPVMYIILIDHIVPVTTKKTMVITKGMNHLCNHL